ncbi:gliding motility-associated C-terminal domain-containing protein, partial [Flavobacterium sp.]|uniref:gliding motility-associated C-terminal domain-containing protein n=1 Tax=Flavobacterium sp. TaxID=239 RepID=UPI00248A0730
LQGTPQAGGIWTPTLASGTGVFDPTVDTAATYTYTVGACTPPSTATVIVDVIAAPNSGGIGQTLTTCANVTSVDLFAGLDGTQGTGSWNDDDASGALVNNIFNPSTVGVGTYNFTYTVVGTAPCGTSASTVTVVVNLQANAGTAVAAPSICTSVGTIDLNTLLTGQDSGGTWSDTTPVDISNFVAGTYTYTYSVSNSCGIVDTEEVQFIILPNPILTSANVTSSQACIGTDVVVNLTGMVDGPYNLNYSLSGSNTLANQITTVTIIGGIGSFTIPAASVPNAGTSTITFNTIQDANSTCQITLTSVIATITINPLVQIDNANIAVSAVCLGSDAIVVISNAVSLPDGVYQFDYAIPGATPPTGNSGNVTITGGNGQFTVPASVFGTVSNYTITISGIIYTSGCSNTTQDANITFSVVGPLTAGTFSGIQSVCPSVGIFDLATLLTGQSSGGVWTDSASVAVTSPLNIINFAAGTYSYTYIVTNACGTDTEVVQFTILATPQLTTVNISTIPSCIGTNATINLSGMADGTYTLNYDLSGSNTLVGQSVVVTIAAGIGSFTVPTASIPNVGTTIITFTSIANTTSTCTTILTNVAAQISIIPLADIDNTNLSVANGCLGDAIVVAIAGATNLPDGVYQFNYSIPTANPVSGTSGNVTITSGVGSFTIPSATFTAAANYTITITGIITSTGCSNTNENASANFTINPLLNTTGATVSAQDTCPTFGSLVTISGATGLTDGTYSITYQLTGANTATTTISVTFTGGVATFAIPGAAIITNGDTTITFTQLTSTIATCGITGTIFPNDVFNVTSLPSPELIADGYQFCGTNVPAPTIADLSANVVGTPNLIWYDAATGGTAYGNTDLLVDGATYYGAVLSVNGCESSRLEVQIDLSFCDIEIPDGFSPNNDGINDTFEIPNLAILYPKFKMEIYNRYGNLIYTGNKNFPNFDGTTTENGFKLGNNLLPTGVYFYILEFNDGIRKAIQGRLYLNR